MSHQRAGPSSGPGSEPPFHVMLTCYTLFERDSTEQKLDRKFLRGWDWSHLILDEAHAVKNSSAMRTVRLNKCAPSGTRQSHTLRHSLRALGRPRIRKCWSYRVAERCKRRVMLTGTPLQNDLEELQNLLRFLMPKLFTDAEASDIQKITVSPTP